MYPNFGYLSKFRKWDTHFDLLEKKKEEEFIGLKIEEINNELVIVNEELSDRELTSDYYINEYFRLCDKIILIKFNLEDGIVMNVGKDTYVIKESFNKNRTMSEIIQKLIRVDINKLT